MKRLIAPLLAFSLLASGMAVAAPQDPSRGADRSHQDEDRDNDRHGGRQTQKDTRQHGPEQRGAQQASQHGPQQHQPPRKGDRLAQGHRGQRVDDYRKHDLKRPPKGHEWRKVDDRYVLIAVATGIVASVIANGR